jgi:hypothetical protein
MFGHLDINYMSYIYDYWHLQAQHYYRIPKLLTHANEYIPLVLGGLVIQDFENNISCN